MIQQPAKWRETGRLHPQTLERERSLLTESHYDGERTGGFSLGLSTTALAQACSTDSVYISRNKSIKFLISVYNSLERVKKEALLDCGATECFVYPRMVDKGKLLNTPMKKSRKVRNVNGTTNRMGTITHEVQLMIQYGKYVTLHRFLIADIGEDDLILGYPFFKAANSHIYWAAGTLEGSIILSSYSGLKNCPSIWGFGGDWLVSNQIKYLKL